MDAVFATLIDAKRFGSDVPTADSVRPTTESGRPRSSPSVSQHQTIASDKTTSHATHSRHAAGAWSLANPGSVRTSVIVAWRSHLIGSSATCSATPRQVASSGHSTSDGSISSVGAWPSMNTEARRRRGTTWQAASAAAVSRSSAASKTAPFGASINARIATGSDRLSSSNEPRASGSRPPAAVV